MPSPSFSKRYPHSLSDQSQALTEPLPGDAQRKVIEHDVARRLIVVPEHDGHPIRPVKFDARERRVPAAHFLRTLPRNRVIVHREPFSADKLIYSYENSPLSRRARENLLYHRLPSFKRFFLSPHRTPRRSRPVFQNFAKFFTQAHQIVAFFSKT